MSVVSLTAPELLIASNIGMMRRISNLKRNICAKYGAPDKEGAWEIDVIACMGEMAVAKHFNLFWAGSVNNFSAVDVGGLIEVRTRRQSWHQLILHPADKDHLPYVLVHADPPAFDLIGWAYGADGKQDKYWSDPAGNRPAFFVPQADLRPIEMLRVEIQVLDT
jgi:hypothetical protein